MGTWTRNGVLLVLVACLLFQVQRVAWKATSVGGYQEVPLVEAASQEELVEHIHQLRTPFRLAPEPSLAPPDWSLDFLREKWVQSPHNVLSHAKNSSQALFLLRSDVEQLSHFPYRLEDMPSEDFFDYLQEHRVPSDRYIYHSGPLHSWPEALQAPLQPYLRRYSLDHFDLPPSKHSSEYKSQAMMWMGSDGVVANGHYDRSHNLFVQLVGEKVWTLFPPADLSSLYLYPPSHPSYHQSRVGHIDRVDEDAFPLFSRHGAPFRVHLHPGDVLYIPPYWLHQVETVNGPAVSLSVVSPSALESRVGQTYWAAQTIWEESEWRTLYQDTRLLLAESLCVSLIQEVKEFPSARTAWQWLAHYEHSRSHQPMPWVTASPSAPEPPARLWDSLRNRFQQLAQMIRTLPEPDLVDLILGDCIDYITHGM